MEGGTKVESRETLIDKGVKGEERWETKRREDSEEKRGEGGQGGWRGKGKSGGGRGGRGSGNGAEVHSQSNRGRAGKGTRTESGDELNSLISLPRFATCHSLSG